MICPRHKTPMHLAQERGDFQAWVCETCRQYTSLSEKLRTGLSGTLVVHKIAGFGPQMSVRQPPPAAPKRERRPREGEPVDPKELLAVMRGT